MRLFYFFPRAVSQLKKTLKHVKNRVFEEEAFSPQNECVTMNLSFLPQNYIEVCTPAQQVAHTGNESSYAISTSRTQD